MLTKLQHLVILQERDYLDTTTLENVKLKPSLKLKLTQTHGTGYTEDIMDLDMDITIL